MKNLVKVERARKNITQAELATEMKCNRQTINSIETKKYIPNVMLVLKMAKYFNMPVEELFTLDEGD